jgi:hypothetical protein
MRVSMGASALSLDDRRWAAAMCTNDARTRVATPSWTSTGHGGRWNTHTAQRHGGTKEGLPDRVRSDSTKGISYARCPAYC